MITADTTIVTVNKAMFFSIKAIIRNRTRAIANNSLMIRLAFVLYTIIMGFHILPLSYIKVEVISIRLSSSFQQGTMYLISYLSAKISANVKNKHLACNFNLTYLFR